MHFDSKQLLFLPPWARVMTLCATLLTLGASVAVALTLMGDGERADWILVAMSLAQLSLAAFLFVIVAFYSSRDENVDRLLTRSDEFLCRHVRKALTKVTVPDIGVTEMRVECEPASNIFGRRFRLTQGDFEYHLWIGLNVHRLFVIYFVSAPADDPTYAEHLKKVFNFTFGGAEAVNYKANYELAHVGGESVVSIWLTAPTAKDLLTDPTEKLFWAQDIAMMTGPSCARRRATASR